MTPDVRDELRPGVSDVNGVTSTRRKLRPGTDPVQRRRGATDELVMAPDVTSNTGSSHRRGDLVIEADTVPLFMTGFGREDTVRPHRLSLGK
jgi:hypothetical protein